MDGVNDGIHVHAAGAHRARRARLGLIEAAPVVRQEPRISAPVAPAPAAAPAWPRERALALVDAVAARHGVSVAQIMDRSRQPAVVMARAEAMARIATAFPTWSLPHLGRFFGGRDHSTVLHALAMHVAASGETVRGLTPEEAIAKLDDHRARVRAAHRRMAARAEDGAGARA